MKLLPLNCSSHSLIDSISPVFKSLKSSYSCDVSSENFARALLISFPPNTSYGAPIIKLIKQYVSHVKYYSSKKT